MYLSDVKLYFKTKNIEEFFSKPRNFQNVLIKTRLVSNPRKGSQLLNKLKKRQSCVLIFRRLFILDL